MRMSTVVWSALVVPVSLVLTGCGDDGPTVPQETLDSAICTLDESVLWSSLPPNAIPALNEPSMVGPFDPGAEYLRAGDRVLGVVVDGEARAYPHNILWHHEVINDRIGDRWLTVTFCPLTGSGVAFDPTSIDGSPIDFGVSGLLFANNLVMYDRETGDLFGPQLSASGQCSRFKEETLDFVPVLETSWDRWRELHPNTTVVGEGTGFGRNYQFYPYSSYDELSNDDLLFSMPVDRRRPIKERVLAIRTGETGGRGYPFGELASLGATAALNERVGGLPVTVFYEASSGGTAMAYRVPSPGGVPLTFEPDGDGTFRDHQTGSLWSIEGRAIEGELAGTELEAHSDAYVLFWFAWRFFQPDGTTFGMDG